MLLLKVIKMNYINELLTELTARLPELEWKLTSLNIPYVWKKLPKGLFRLSHQGSGTTFVDEIKADIEQLSRQDNERSAYFLAEQIKQKVTVLVALCQIEGRTTKVVEKKHFGIKSLGTRQQWLQNMEAEIQILSKQQVAMANSLAQIKPGAEPAMVLSVHAELGEVERQLTLAQEALKKATLLG